MTLEPIDVKNLMLDNSISELRNVPEYVAMCDSHADGLLNIQETVNFLSDAINVNKAQGIWLDYIGWLVGIKRSYRDISKFFSVNETHNVTFYTWVNNNVTVYTEKAETSVGDNVYSDIGETYIVLGTVNSYSNNEITVIVNEQTVTYEYSGTTSIKKGDLNVEKYFWFAHGNVDENGSLEDEIYHKRIFGKILYNKSKCTRNENIAIIKYMTNADHCIIEKIAPMLFDITLYGDEIVETISMRDEVESYLGEGRGIRNFTVRSLSEYE